MLGWLWKLNRWYDDLNYRDMGTQRFLIFFALLIIFFIIIPWGSISIFGVSPLISSGSTLFGLCVLLIPRVIWIETPILREKYPSRF